MQVYFGLHGGYKSIMESQRMWTLTTQIRLVSFVCQFVWIILKFEQIIISVFNFEVGIKSFLSLYIFISVKQCGIFVKFEEKTNVFWICLSSLYPFTDWLTTHLDSRINKWVFVLLDSVKSKTTHSTCSVCIHSLMRSLWPYISLHVIDMALLEQVSDSQLESELSGGNKVFAVL